MIKTRTRWKFWLSEEIETEAEIWLRVDLHPDTVREREERAEALKLKRLEDEEMKEFHRMIMAERTRRHLARIPTSEWGLFEIPAEWKYMHASVLSRYMCDRQLEVPGFPDITRLFGIDMDWGLESGEA